jgi:hypothetical protein
MRHADTCSWTLLEYEEEQRKVMIRARGEAPPGISSDDYPVLVNLYWRIESDSGSGMPSDDEMARMSLMEDLLHEMDGPDVGFMMFAVTGNSRKEWIWYLHDQTTFLDGLNRHLAGQEPFPIEIEVAPANGWASYNDIAAHFRN